MSNAESDDQPPVDDKKPHTHGDFDRRISIISEADGSIVNASGHRDALVRQYGLLDICGLALNIDSAWIALAGSLSVAILNGGPPGILYEFIVACVFYSFIGASLAELASAIPSSGGVYHYASITAGKKYGRIVGFYAAYLNLWGWVFDMASIVSIPSNIAVAMYATYHPAYVPKAWHSYIAFLIITWSCTALVIFGNRIIPFLQRVGLFLIVFGGLATIIVVAAVPSTHASNDFVFRHFQNGTGWSSGIAFLTGILNGCFTIGTSEAICHLAEEMPNPRVDIPKAIFAQIFLGFITTFVYAIAILYSINDLTAVTDNVLSFPVAEVYRQATGSRGGTLGLLLIILFSMLICTIGTILMVGRLLWTLARDKAFLEIFAVVDEERSCPVRATLLCSVICSGLGAIQIGSSTAFLDLVGSFIILTTVSYMLAFLGHLLSGRKSVRPGPFWMKGATGFLVNGIACILIPFFNVFFCYPYSHPVEVGQMNYNSVIFAGVLVITTLLWLGSRNTYLGPKTEVFQSSGS